MALQLDHDALVAAVEAAASGGATAVGVPAGGLNVAMPNVEAPVDAPPDVQIGAPDPGQGAPLPVESPAPTPPSNDPTAPFLTPTSQPPAQMPWSPQAAGLPPGAAPPPDANIPDRKSTRLNSSHANISYAVFCLKKKKNRKHQSSATKVHQRAPHPVGGHPVICCYVAL